MFPPGRELSFLFIFAHTRTAKPRHSSKDVVSYMSMTSDLPRWAKGRKKKVSNQSTTHSSRNSLGARWSAAFPTFLQIAWHYYYYFFPHREMFLCSNKLENQSNFAPCRGESPIPQKARLCLRGGIWWKEQEYRGRWRESRDGCDTRCCAESISDYRHGGKVVECICPQCVRMKALQRRASSGDGGFGDAVKCYTHDCTGLRF